MPRCPYLGLKEDPTTSTAFPSTANYCHRASPCAPVRLVYQENYCLTDNHITCPVFQSENPNGLPRNMRAPSRLRKQRGRQVVGFIFLLATAVVLLLAAWLRRDALAAWLPSLIPQASQGGDEPALASLPTLGSTRLAQLPTQANTPTPPPSPTAQPTATPSPTAPATWTPVATSTKIATPSPTATATVFLSPTPGSSVMIIVDRANVRTGPGPEYQVVGVAVRGEQYEVTGRNRTGDWWQICCLNGQPGWLFSELATIQNESEAIPIIENIPPPPPSS